MRLFILAFTLSILMIPGVLALDVNVAGISPQPVEPGGDLTITISVTNTQDTDIYNFRSEFNPEFPFIIKSSGDNFDSGFICGRCDVQNTYFLSVDTSAVSGIYHMIFNAFEGETEVEKDINVEVKGEPNIIFAISSGDLDRIIPGTDFTISMQINNIGSGSAKEIRIIPDSTNFIALGSSTKILDTLEPGESKSVFFQFLASKNLNADSYQIPFDIDYKNADGDNLNSSGSVGVRVIESGSLNVQSIKVVSDTTGSSIFAGVPFNIIVRLENVGTGDADGIATGLNCPFDSPKKTFTGQLEKDEDSPAVFTLNSNEAGSFECALNISYQDDLGDHYLEESFDVSIKRIDPTGNIVFLIIIIMIIIFVFRKRIFRRKK